jgi:hypothetical protein
MRNHKKEAEGINLEAIADNAMDGTGRGIIVGLDALRHATLALVEQQKIANLIALGSYRVTDNQLPPFRHLVMDALGEYDVTPTATIREGLDL